MLKNISPCLSPELLKVLCEMGHGDEIVLADAHFPGNSTGRYVIRADGVAITTLLHGILPLFELDAYVKPLAMMAIVKGDITDPFIEEEYLKVIKKYAPDSGTPERLEEEKFLARAKNAYVIVMTGETRKYGNLILRKGLTPPYRAQ